MTFTLHVDNTVRDFDSWKAVFDKFDRFRVDKGVRSYRISRDADQPNRVTIDLDFDSHDEATTFRGALEQIQTTPQSKNQLIEHEVPQILEVVEHHTL